MIFERIEELDREIEIEIYVRVTCQKEIEKKILLFANVRTQCGKHDRCLLNI